MANAVCEKCNRSIDDICTKEKHYKKLLKLLRERVKRWFGVPYNISPGIRHCEIIKSNSFNNISKVCDGVLYYKPWYKDPKKWKFDISLLD
jgi:hypothetical protein